VAVVVINPADGFTAGTVNFVTGSVVVPVKTVALGVP
jgi:hypothetical protein